MEMLKVSKQAPAMRVFLVFSGGGKGVNVPRRLTEHLGEPQADKCHFEKHDIYTEHILCASQGFSCISRSEAQSQDDSRSAVGAQCGHRLGHWDDVTQMTGNPASAGSGLHQSQGEDSGLEWSLR